MLEPNIFVKQIHVIIFLFKMNILYNKKAISVNNGRMIYPLIVYLR